MENRISDLGRNNSSYVHEHPKLDMIWVEPGTFTMGSDELKKPWPSAEEAYNVPKEPELTYASPAHEVTLTRGYYLGKYEVTMSQWRAVMLGNTKTNSSGDVVRHDYVGSTTDPFNQRPVSWYGSGASAPNIPVNNVYWDDVQVFLECLNEQEAENIPEGWAYVLPTEAQWEYACRAGTTTNYSWGDSITPSNANYNSEGILWPESGPTDVGSFNANPWGFYDMHGNVEEWTSDWFSSYSADLAIDPINPPEVIRPLGNNHAGADGKYRVLRGGSWAINAWGNNALEVTSHTRSTLGSGRKYHNLSGHDRGRIGFRLSLQKIKDPEVSSFELHHVYGAKSKYFAGQKMVALTSDNLIFKENEATRSIETYSGDGTIGFIMPNYDLKIEKA